MKRENGIAHIKKTPAYIVVTVAGHKRSVTPDPYDKNVSKRAWEKSVMQFRKHLREELHELHAH